MSEPIELPLHCVCGYQAELDRRADEIERLRAERLELWHLINNIDRAIHSKEPINPWWNDRVVSQQSKQWPSLWLNIRRACTEYLKVDARG